MAEIIFNYNGNLTIIQCNKEEKMKEIFNKFILKAQIDKNLITYIYSGNSNINEELKFEEIANQEDKLRNKMNILVYDNNNIINNNISIIKSKDIICPICNENIKLYIEDYNIFLYECKNKHEIDNILFNEFEEKQKIDLSKIKFEECKEKNRNETFNNIF